MKKRRFICFLIFTMFILGFLISDVAFGQSLQAGLTKYKQTLLRGDVRSLLPDFLKVFNGSKAQKDMQPQHVGVLLGKPIFLRTLVPETDNQFIALLYLDKDFRTLFGDDQFYRVLKISTETDRLLNWFDELPPLLEGPGSQKVTTPPRATTLEIVSGDDQSGEVDKPLAQPFVVGVLDQDRKPLEGTAVTFKVTKGGGQTRPPKATTNKSGEAQTTLTLGSNVGVNKVKASVVDYPSLTQTFTAAATGVPGGEPPKPTELNIVSGNNQSGKSGKPLARPFVVSVKDKGGEPLGGVDVTFEVSEGGGKLWDKLRQTITTNEKGEAGITLTLGPNVGVNQVQASVVSTLQRTFTAAATIAAATASLPVVYWIEDGSILKFDGEKRKELVTPSNGWIATGLAVDMVGSKLYWTEQKPDGSQIKGKIQSADLNGENSETLQSIQALPESIVVNTKNDRLYWTNDRGKIQSINVNGKDFNGNFIERLGSPRHIALSLDGDADTAFGTLYWTAYDATADSWSIWFKRLGSSMMKKSLLTDLGELKGVAVAGDKLYWTEKVSDNQGKISSASRSGSGGKTLSYVPGSVPLGLAVDEVGRRLYWTDSSGNIQSLNLNKPIEIVVEGLNVRAVAIALGRLPGGSVPTSSAAPSMIAEHSVESTLLANYPNPFNPETWIPYQLSESADVSASIYAVDGRLVRRLDLGHQSAGVYRSRSRAAYWDGRNEFGERVASGLYFYTLTAGDFTATRKMLIRK